MTKRSLPEKIVALSEALESVPHAFGGAIALAYYAEPRATIDIDLNVFVPAPRAREIATVLVPLGVAGELRAIADMNRSLDASIETIFLTCLPQYTSVASTLVRDVIRNGGDVSQFLPKEVQEEIKLRSF